MPLIEGAPEAVERLAAHLPLGLASSSNREIIELFLELSGLGCHFAVTVSSEEVERGKPGHRGRGLGAALVARALVEAAAGGHRALSLSVEPDNLALRLYRRLGFEKVGESGGSWTLLAPTDRVRPGG